MIQIFKKPTTINITLSSTRKGEKTKTLSVIVPNKSDTVIDRLKKDVQHNVINELQSDTSTDKITLLFRRDRNTRAGQLRMSTNKSVQDVYDYFLNM